MRRNRGDSRKESSITATHLAGKDAAPITTKSGRSSRWFSAALVTAAAIFVAVQLAPQTLGEAARRHLQQQLQQHYAKSRVTVRRGHYQRDLGFVFDDIRIEHPFGAFDGDDDSSVVGIDRVVVVTNFDREKIADHENPFVSKRIIVDGLRVDTTVTERGEFSIEELWPLPKFGPTVPRIELRNTEVRLMGTGHANDRLPLHFDNILLLSDPESGEANGDRSWQRTIHEEFGYRIQMHAVRIGRARSIELVARQRPTHRSAAEGMERIFPRCAQRGPGARYDVRRDSLGRRHDRLFGSHRDPRWSNGSRLDAKTDHPDSRTGDLRSQWNHRRGIARKTGRCDSAFGRRRQTTFLAAR